MGDKANIKCKIRSIADSTAFGGYVEVMLDPIDKSIFKREDISKEHNDIKIIGGGPLGVIPIGNAGQMMEVIMEKIPFDGRQKLSENNDPRGILWIEDSVEFLNRRWNFGDTIEVSLKKVDG